MPCKKCHEVHMRARKTKSFQNLSFRSDFNIKTSKTQWFSKKMSKFHPARSCGFVGNPTLFLNISVKRAFASNFFTCFELLQQRLRTCQGHHPCQIIPCGTHSFFLRARTPKSSKTIGFLKNFSTAHHKITRIAP